MITLKPSPQVSLFLWAGGMACTSLQLMLLPTFSISELFISSSAAISLFYWSPNHLQKNFCSLHIPPGTVKKKIKFNFLLSLKLFSVPQLFLNEFIFPRHDCRTPGTHETLAQSCPSFFSLFPTPSRTLRFSFSSYETRCFQALLLCSLVSPPFWQPTENHPPTTDTRYQQDGSGAALPSKHPLELG